MTARRQGRGPTRADVARLAGTSTAVVSYVVNGGPRPVAAATRARVLGAVNQLGYRPDRIARALAARRTETVGLVVADITNPFMSDVARAVEGAASARGHTVLLANSAVDHQREQLLIEQLLDRRVDGLILLAVGPAAATVRELNRSGVPVVAVDRPVGGLRAATVTVDNVGGAAEATRHLAGHGHRRIACISGPPPLWPTAEREKGWSAAVAEMGLGRGACPVVHASIDRGAGYEAAARLLRRARPPSAVFVTTDEQAFGVLRAAVDAGRRVPDDLAVVSFDGISQAAFSVPGLSSVVQPVDQMAVKAVDLLLDGPPERVVFPVDLLTRGSCGCPDPVVRAKRRTPPPTATTGGL
ncbi:MAG: LacI family DNA-binding transcriptional regulator [Acidobacteriota bacterium]|nr:LacI family DNA-binding transcriptional regulator [Acidobacteriota bacterium]